MIAAPLRSRLVILASALVFVDTVFFSVLAPLLPHFVSSRGLSEAQAGFLSGSYALGALIAAIPAGVLVSRVGSKNAVQAGLAVLAASTLVFAVSPDTLALDTARIVQGGSGALVFSGALTWVIHGMPESSRGAAIGTATGAGVFGALAGPLLGGLAASIGVGVAFGAMVGIIGVLAIATMTFPDAKDEGAQSWGDVLRTLMRPSIRLGVALLLVPGICFGVLGIVAPLRIDSLGGGAGIIAGAYAASAVIEGGMSPFIGSRSDRIGRRRPYLLGVGICAIAVLCLALAPSLEAALAAFLVSAIGGGLCVAPGFAFISDSAMALSVHQGLAVAFANMAWSGGQALGGLGGGALAWSGGFSLPLFIVFALLTATMAFASRPGMYGPGRMTSGRW